MTTLPQTTPLRSSLPAAPINAPHGPHIVAAPVVGMPGPRAMKADLQKSLHVNAISDSQLVRVSFEGSDPRDCKLIVEEIVNAHLAREWAKAENSFNQRTKALRDMKDGYERQLAVV